MKLYVYIHSTKALASWYGQVQVESVPGGTTTTAAYIIVSILWNLLVWSLIPLCKPTIISVALFNFADIVIRVLLFLHARYYRSGRICISTLRAITCMAMANLLIALSLLNFSLALMVGLIYTPLFLLVAPSQSKFKRILLSLATFGTSPSVLLGLLYYFVSPSLAERILSERMWNGGLCQYYLYPLSILASLIALSNTESSGDAEKCVTNGKHAKSE